MIVDSSALLAVLREEPGHEQLLRPLLSTPSVRMSAATYLESAIVIDALQDPVLSRRFDELLEAIGIEVVPVTFAQARNRRERHTVTSAGAATTRRG